ncbi:dihydroneopterin aldolase [Candidatus Kinetoplastidibacterium galati]|uniref:Dihydroneopterin aldolase n=1 Tax=Candidatus Kinetoplastidibacterium galati TCC219 TaxID=1208921 RepID=M1LTB9_9PROT|nr:dihydroneopterin aldolase [Candidatus Kinetoplastibacterium galatii]AGF48772.1 dihydroneopterin aldolase [Candidatus Kinetoplastibacterium galatii TCC219]
MRFSRKILISDLFINSSIGILEKEINNKQRINILAILEVESSPTTADDINNVLDYRHIVDTITKIANSRHFGLIETLSYNISSTLLSTFSEIISLKLTISKFDVFDNCKSISIEEEYHK